MILLFSLLSISLKPFCVSAILSVLSCYPGLHYTNTLHVHVCASHTGNGLPGGPENGPQRSSCKECARTDQLQSEDSRFWSEQVFGSGRVGLQGW